MPILEFANKENLFSWSVRFASLDRYIVIVTDSNEIIFHPRKTSRPIVFAYYKTYPRDLEKVLSRIEEEGYTVIRVENYHWDTERFPSSGALT